MKWTDELAGTVTTLSRQGLSASEIAKKTGLTRNAIIGKMNRLKAGIPHATRASWNEERLSVLRFLCAQDHSIAEIAAQMGMDYRQVRDCIKYRNIAYIKMRKSPEPSAVDVFLPYPAWKKWNQQRRAQNVERV